MPRSLILFALMACSAQAQVADKALHGSVSALIGAGLRTTMDNRAAFAATVGIGLAKELHDAQQPGNTFSRGDLAWDIAGAALATLTPPPDRVGVLGRSWHFNTTGTKRHLTDNTPGAMLSWSADWLPWERGYIDAAIYSNSQGHPSAYFGVSKEWRVMPRVYFGVGGGAVWGYRRLEHEDSLRPVGDVPADAVKFGCIPGYCLWERWAAPRWQPAVMAQARIELAHGLSLTATYMPAGALGRVTHKDSFWKPADSLTVGVNWRRTF